MYRYFRILRALWALLCFFPGSGAGGVRWAGLRSLVLLLGLVGGGLSAQISLSTIRGEVTAVSLDSDFLSDIGSNNTVAVSGQVQFGLNLVFTNGTERFRVGFQLVDSLGNIVPLANGTAGSTTTVFDDDVEGNPDTGFLVSLSSPFNPSAIFNVAAELDPAVTLDPYETYAARLVLSRWDSSLIFPTYVGVATDDSALGSIYHFTGTAYFDLALNVISTVESAVFSNRSYLETSSGLGDDEHFLVDVATTARRFDPTFTPPTSTAVNLRYDVEMFELVTDGPDVPVPLVTSAFAFSPLVPSHDLDGLELLPVELALAHKLELVPDGVQLDPVNATYYVEVTVTHLEVPLTSTDRIGNLVASSAETLLHLNGDLDFGGIPVVLLAMGVDPSTSYSPSATYLETVLSAGEGFLADHPGYLFGPGPITLRLFADGSAQAISPTPEVSVTPPTTPDQSLVNGVLFGRSNTRLSLSFGLLSDFLVRLPAGMGFTEDATSHRLENTLALPGQRLDANLEPFSNDYSYSTGVPLFVMEESKPVLFESFSIGWNVTLGRFDVFQQADPRYVREDELAAIEAAPVPAAEKRKRSNEHYYRTVTRTGNDWIYVQAGDREDALIEGSFFFNAGSFVSHFPYGVGIQYDFGGFMEFVDDQVVVGSSALSGVFELAVPYAQGCTDGDCGGAGTGPTSGMAINLGGGNLLFTPDGGLVGSGPIDLATYPDFLEWGAIQTGPLAGSFAHTTTNFFTGTFHMSGHFLRGADNTALSDEDGAAVIHYTGFDAVNPATVERPGTNGYLLGLTDYAGINLRVEFDAAAASASYVAGRSVSFDLTGRCKYNLRPGGVTGIHEAVPGSFPADFDLYGYDFTFVQYGLSHLDGVPRESRTEGSFALPYPSNVTQGFEELLFSCVGSLANPVKLADGGGDWLLEFWLADTVLHTVHFSPLDNCDPTKMPYLQAGVTAYASHVVQPLYGTLGFTPDGEIITALSNPAAGVNSRLRLPNTISLDGPGDEVYAMTTLTDVYYGDYSEALTVYAQSFLPPGEGKVNFAATMDVTFFEDLEVHVQTSASKTWTAVTPLYLMGGWEVGGNLDTFFNRADFDAAHVGFPAGVPPAVYRNDPGNSGDPTPYLIHARQDWLGVVNFNYPLQFNRTTRTFTSYAPEEDDLLVISTSHQIDYLSAENAEISFGITYEGLPRINLASFVINRIDEETGALAAITEAAQEQVVGALEDGIDEMGTMVADRMDDFYAQFFALLEGELIDPLCTEINTIGATVDRNDPVAFKAQVQAILIQRLETASNSLRARIRALADPGGVVSGSGLVLDEIDAKLAFVENGIRAVIDEVAIDTDGFVVVDPDAPGALVDSYLSGILKADSLGQYPIVQNLVRALLAEFAPDLQSELEILLSEPVAALNAEVDALLTDAKPTIEELKNVLTDLAGQVNAVRQEIAAVQAIATEIETIFTAADAEIVALTTDIRTEIESFFAQDVPTFGDFEEIDCDAVKVAIRQAVNDNFLGSAFVAEVQIVLKQYLYDIDAAITEAVDTAFAQVNLVTRDFLAGLLSEVDDTINGFLDDLDAVLGAGKIDGFAHIQGDALKLLRLDLYLQLKVPDDLEFHGYLQIKQLDSEGDDSCSLGSPDAPATEVTVGATDVPVSWTSDGLRMSVGGKFNFQSNPSFKLLGLGGSLELTGGVIGFQDFGITELGAAIMFGASENYLAAELGLKFNSYEAFGGAFFGRTCTIDPLLLVDEDVADILGAPNPTFTGIYVYGECHIPISEAVLGIPASCFFRISAGVGAGAFYFFEDNTLGGKIYASVSGEALCIVSIKGEVTMIGLVSQGSLRFNGKGSLSGKVGVCPFCIKFRESVEISYEDGDWGVEL
jgi:hypothetical protein